MKKWLVNKILGYDIFYMVDEIKRQREYWEKQHDNTDERLLKVYENNAYLRLESWDLSQENTELKKELCVKKNKVIAKLEIIEEVQKELKNKNGRIKFLEEELEKEKYDHILHVADMKLQINKYKKINQEMISKKVGKLSTKELFNVLQERKDVDLTVAKKLE